MERRNELKSKARELERAHRPEEALAVYTELLERAEEPAPAARARAGDLQLALGQVDAARESLARAAAEFAEQGRVNLAIALWRRLVESRGDGPEVQGSLAALSLKHGYRTFAREATAAYARTAIHRGPADSGVEAILAFLQRFPDERELWRDWVEELLAMGRDDEAAAALERLQEGLEAAGQEDAARPIAAELRRLRGGATRAADEPTRGELEAEEIGESDLPLLGTDLEPTREVAADAGDTGAIAPLAGLETTGLADSFESLEHPAPAEEAVPESGGPAEADDEDSEGDPLPLLGDSPGDQGRDSVAAAVAGVQGPTDDIVETSGLEEDSAAPAAENGLADDDVALPSSPADFAAGEGSAIEPEAGTEFDDAEGPPEDLPLLGATEPTREAAPIERAQDPEPSEQEPAPALDLRKAVAELLRLSNREAAMSEDPATHYDLGVAFKEMGLYDESLAHLTAALEGGNDPVATLEVLGEVLVERGHFQVARELLSGVAGSVGGAAELVAIQYWLARSAEELGDFGDARRGYEKVLAIESSFRDAPARLERL